LTFANDAVKPLERMWLILAKLFEELVAHGIEVDASHLQDSKALLHLVRTSPVDPCAAQMSGSGNPLMSLEESLERAKGELMSASLRLGETRAEYWRERIYKAELDEAELRVAYGESRFLPGLPRDPTTEWARLTLQQPVGQERAKDVAEQFGVLVEFEDDLHLVFEGEPLQVRRALADVYYLSQP